MNFNFILYNLPNSKYFILIIQATVLTYKGAVIIKDKVVIRKQISTSLIKDSSHFHYHHHNSTIHLTQNTWSSSQKVCTNFELPNLALIWHGKIIELKITFSKWVFNTCIITLSAEFIVVP